jgi:hypothetical protein
MVKPVILPYIKYRCKKGKHKKNRIGHPSAVYKEFMNLIYDSESIKPISLSRSNSAFGVI